MAKVINITDLKKNQRWEQGDLISLSDGIDEEEVYIIARVDYNKFCLISLQDGTRWEDPIVCKNYDDLIELRTILQNNENIESITLYKSKDITIEIK